MMHVLKVIYILRQDINVPENRDTHAEFVTEMQPEHGGTGMRSRAQIEATLRRFGASRAAGYTEGHRVTQQSDEYACKCGARWPVSDGKEHP